MESEKKITEATAAGASAQKVASPNSQQSVAAANFQPTSAPASQPEIAGQAPSDGVPHPGAHVHAQITPPYRNRERLKFLAGTELGAGFYAMDALPEDKARELQAVEVDLR